MDVMLHVESTFPLHWLHHRRLTCPFIQYLLDVDSPVYISSRDYAVCEHSTRHVIHALILLALQAITVTARSTWRICSLRISFSSTGTFLWMSENNEIIGITRLSHHLAFSRQVFVSFNTMLHLAFNTQVKSSLISTLLRLNLPKILLSLNSTMQ